MSVSQRYLPLRLEAVGKAGEGKNVDRLTEGWDAWKVNRSMGFSCGLMVVVEPVALCQWPHWRHGAVVVGMWKPQ